MGNKAVLARYAQQIYRRLLHRYDNLGVRGLVGMRRMPGLPQRTHSAHPFDVQHGTETGGFVPGEALATGSAADLYNTAYYAISPSTLRAALARIPGALDRFAFVDLGCGKGRALLVAAECAFASVVGVEIAPALAETARRNCAVDPRLHVVTEDARGVAYPEQPLLVFLYHPFLWPVVRDALSNLERQLRARPRPAWVLFANPSYDRKLAGIGFLEPVWDLRFALSADDAAADRHGISDERYTLFRTVL
jgi:SAM-dependent methyltransferase